MIRALDPKLNPATAEIQALRNQLGERDKQIVNLEVSLYYHAFLLFLFWTRTRVLFQTAASVWAGQTERIRREDDRHSVVQQGTVGLKWSLFLTSVTVSHRHSCLHPQSLNFQRLAMESRLGGCTSAGPTQSFLSQQRQVANAPRRALSVNTSATTSK